MKLKCYILTHRPYFACVTLFSTILSIGLLKSSVLPLTVVLGAVSGGSLAVVHKGSLSRRERELRATELALAERQATQDDREYQMLEQVSTQKQILESSLETQAAQIQQALDAQKAALEAEKEQLEKRKEEIESQLPAVIARVELAEETAQTSIQQAEEEKQAQIQQTEEYLRDVYGRVAGRYAQENALLKTPDLTEGGSLEEMQADRVIHTLRQHGLVVKEPIVKPTSTGFVLRFKILPKLLKVGGTKDGKDSETLLTVGDAIKVIEANGKTLASVVKGCKSAPHVEPVHQGISLIFDTTGIDKADRQRIAQKIEDGVLEPNENWFEEAVAACQHIRVTGERDSGKSTFVSNLVDVKRRQNPGCAIKLSNPLYGSKKDRWNIPAVWKSVDEAIEGLQEAHDLLMQRSVINRNRKDDGLPPQEFEPILYIFDEIDFTVSTHGEDATKLIKGCLTKGTHYDVHILYLGQSPLCSSLGLKKHDFNHSTNFHLGQNIGRALDDNRNLSTQAKEELRNQAQLRRERGDEFIVYCDYGKTHFMAFPPAPGFYQKLDETPADDSPQDTTLADTRQQLEALLDKEVADDSQTAIKPEQPKNRKKSKGDSQPTKSSKVKKMCPQCTSLNTKKNGKKNEVQQYLCNDCGKTFHN